eukprot:TRINITY_DN1529_c0_g1_i1.p1 TRINITY_DN1529_c0_g1~~TRINITY_DN1529_c0_g1_i1.p1  ORF type:complete len:1211 (-),score=268.71 TRINITY_DN1529_c0_g1_i1:635-4267(-)
MAITVGAVCFYKSPTYSWTLGTVESIDPKDTFTCKYRKADIFTHGSENETVGKLKADDIFVMTNLDLLSQDPDDLLMLTLLHDSTLMHSLNQRYFKDIIYTYIGPIVVAFNPFKYTIPWYKDDMMGVYLAEDHVIRKNRPHSWSVAHNTYYEMLDHKADQFVLVSGESGAGKTEAVKIVMKYLIAVSCLNGDNQQKDEAKLVGHKLLQASPILEGFGNAKTVRNDNSSRFGKFMKVQFDKGGFLKGAATTKYLLEKSRIVQAGPNERCYHSFYLLCNGKDAPKYKLERNPKLYKGISSGGCVAIEGVDDAADYAACREAMSDVGISEAEQESIFAVVAGILNILNVEFRADGDKAVYDDSKKAKEWLTKAIELWQIDSAVLEKELISTTREARGEVFTKELTPTQALDCRDSLVKALYDEMFQWLVDKINVSAAAPNAGGNFLGLLDIFGFEDFEVNSFEQMCINLANETLQGHYNEYIFSKDMEECRAEGVDVTFVEFPDNTQCLLLVTGKMGIIDMLDEECALGKGSDEGFLQKISDQHGKHPFFEKKKLAKTSFVIKHYAGDVSYEVAGFLDKNRDTLKDDMKVLMRNSTSPFIKILLPEPVDKTGRKITVGGFFKNQLAELMGIINSTNPHWIRCIKPHPAKKALMWHGVSVLNQLTTSGIIGTVKVRKAGFPIRIFFGDFMRRFRLIKPGPVSDAKNTCAGIIHAMGFDRKVAQVGTTRVFMKTEAYVKLEEKIAVVAAEYILQLQAWARMYLAKKQEKEYDFMVNKEQILAQVKATIELQIAERKSRKAVWEEEFAEASGLFHQLTDQLEQARRAVIAREAEKQLTQMLETERKDRSTLDERRLQALRERQAREKRARDSLESQEQQLRIAMVNEEDQLWNILETMANTEQEKRDRLRESEAMLRQRILDEESDIWAWLVREEQESYNHWKQVETERLSSEWKNLMEDIHSSRENRKAADAANEKYKYDSKRRELTDRKRRQYMSEMLPRDNTLEERKAFDPRVKAIREHQTAKREGDADVVVQKLRDRKELLVGKDTLWKQQAEKLRAEAVQEEKKHRVFGKNENSKHEALSARHYPSERYPLHTFSDPPPSYLFSQKQYYTADEISLARAPSTQPGLIGGPASQRSLTASPRVDGGSPSPAPTDSLTRSGQLVFSPQRTRAAAGLDSNGQLIQPLSPQPAPRIPPKFGTSPSPSRRLADFPI